MKKLLLLALATLVATVSFAQQQLATLNHNDSITVYYGASALQSAHTAAVNGDIITLSAGLFNGFEITKAVTIRGAGMFSNDSLGVQATYIHCHESGYIDNPRTTSFNIPADTNNNLIIEGVNFDYQIYYKNVTNPRFIKCRIRSFNKYDNNSSMNGAQFVNCIIDGFSNNYQNNYYLATDNTFINCVVFELGEGPANLMNCIAMTPNSLSHLSLLNVYNSILYYNIYLLNHTEDLNALTNYYSIGIDIDSAYHSYYNDYRYNDYYSISTVPNNHLTNINSLRRVFKYFNGTYTEGMSFELQDNIANTILGDDSTQVGIYGGLYPFDPNVRNPLIRRCNVANRSTADGKLAIDIEVVSE